ncbi:MAG: hypothetical protein LBK18_10090 [Prevotellaceae bacterium]|nr:hypothetical protein [Prevotellaceae bacterium]
MALVIPSAARNLLFLNHPKCGSRMALVIPSAARNLLFLNHRTWVAA